MAGTSPAMTREKWFNVTGIRSNWRGYQFRRKKAVLRLFGLGRALIAPGRATGEDAATSLSVPKNDR